MAEEAGACDPARATFREYRAPVGDLGRKLQCAPRARVAFYSAFNAVASLALLRLLNDVRTRPLDAAGIEEREHLWGNIVVLLLCIPGAFVLQDDGPWLLLFLVVSGRVARIRRARREARS